MGRLTELRRAEESDAELLAAWHADPEVSRYWDDEHTAAWLLMRFAD